MIIYYLYLDKTFLGYFQKLFDFLFGRYLLCTTKIILKVFSIFILSIQENEKVFCILSSYEKKLFAPCLEYVQ